MPVRRICSSSTATTRACVRRSKSNASPAASRLVGPRTIVSPARVAFARAAQPTARPLSAARRFRAACHGARSAPPMTITTGIRPSPRTSRPRIFSGSVGQSCGWAFTSHTAAPPSSHDRAMSGIKRSTPARSSRSASAARAASARLSGCTRSSTPTARPPLATFAARRSRTIRPASGTASGASPCRTSRSRASSSSGMRLRSAEEPGSPRAGSALRAASRAATDCTPSPITLPGTRCEAQITSPRCTCRR